MSHPRIFSSSTKTLLARHWIFTSGLLASLTLAAQDLAPDSLANTIFVTRPTSPSVSFTNPPQSAILAADGNRYTINLSSQVSPTSVAKYTWTKTSATTGTLTLSIGGLPTSVEVIFASSGKGSYRQTSQGSSDVVVGDISFAPLPQDPTPPLLNLSTRLTLSADRPSITGFVVDGKVPRRVLVRAVGPSLAQFNVSNPAPNPSLTVFKGGTQIGANAIWGGTTSLAAIFSAVGAFALPVTSRDSAIVLTLDPGTYTAQCRDATGGEVLLEVYFVD